MSIEIERKYLLNDPELLQELTRGAPTRIEQGYLSLGTDTPWTTRVRIQIDADGTERATLTAKSKGKLSRNEVETDLDLAIARELFDGCVHKVSKDRYHHDLGIGLVAEVDVFSGLHEGLVIVEVELPSESTPTPFDGVLEDVTEDSQYSTANLASALAPARRTPGP